MTLCKRDKDVATRLIKDLERVDGFEAEIRKYDKVLKDTNASVQMREFARQRIELADEHRNQLKKNLRQW